MEGRRRSPSLSLFLCFVVTGESERRRSKGNDEHVGRGRQGLSTQGRRDNEAGMKWAFSGGRTRFEQRARRRPSMVSELSACEANRSC